MQEYKNTSVLHCLCRSTDQYCATERRTHIWDRRVYYAYASTSFWPVKLSSIPWCVNYSVRGKNDMGAAHTTSRNGKWWVIAQKFWWSVRGVNAIRLERTQRSRHRRGCRGGEGGAWCIRIRNIRLKGVKGEGYLRQVKVIDHSSLESLWDDAVIHTYVQSNDLVWKGILQCNMCLQWKRRTNTQIHIVVVFNCDQSQCMDRIQI